MSGQCASQPASQPASEPSHELLLPRATVSGYCYAISGYRCDLLTRCNLALCCVGLLVGHQSQDQGGNETTAPWGLRRGVL
jgi:hypothetical protein